MKNRNGLGRGEYWYWNILWGVCAAVWYYGFCFEPLPGLSETVSLAVFGGMMAGMVIARAALTANTRRTYMNVAVNVLLPTGLYAVVSLFDRHPTTVTILCLCAAALSLLFCAGVMLRPIRDKERSQAIVKGRVRHAMFGASVVTALTLNMLMVSSTVTAFETAAREIFAETAAVETASEWTLEKQADTVKQLREENWQTLSDDDKMQVLDVMKRIEIEHLGLSGDIELSLNDLDGDLLGYYQTNARRIVISRHHLQTSSASEVLHTLYHECHHAYSSMQVALYREIPEDYRSMMMFDIVEVYEREYAQYIDANEDTEGYASQAVERMAEEYAVDAVADVQLFLEAHP